MRRTTPEGALRHPLKGAVPGQKGPGGPFVPGKESGGNARRGLQGPLAARQSRFRGGPSICIAVAE